MKYIIIWNYKFKSIQIFRSYWKLCVIAYTYLRTTVAKVANNMFSFLRTLKTHLLPKVYTINKKIHFSKNVEERLRLRALLLHLPEAFQVSDFQLPMKNSQRSTKISIITTLNLTWKVDLCHSSVTNSRFP